MSVSEENSKVIYLDYNATTPVDPQVADAVHDALKEFWANPSSTGHELGRIARTALNKSKRQIARLIGLEEEEEAERSILFTSGGTECNNWVIESALQVAETIAKPHIITSDVEHDSVTVCLRHWQQRGRCHVTWLPVDHSTGGVLPEAVMRALRPDTVLVTIMLANNETGALQPVAEVFDSVARWRGDAVLPLLHTDAAQALGKIPVHVQQLRADLITIVGHKFYGPRVGALYASRPMEMLRPLLLGGGQEDGLRAGTENTAMAVGLGAAAALVDLREAEALRRLRDR